MLTDETANKLEQISNLTRIGWRRAALIAVGVSIEFPAIEHLMYSKHPNMPMTVGAVAIGGMINSGPMVEIYHNFKAARGLRTTLPDYVDPKGVPADELLAAPLDSPKASLPTSNT